MQTIFEDAYYQIRLDAPARVVRVRRSAEPFPSIEQAEATFRALLAEIEKQRLDGYRLLVDSREALGRNDDAFEQALGRFRLRLFAPFPRVVMLMRSVAGKLQADRLQRTQGGPSLEVYLDEDEAERALATK